MRQYTIKDLKHSIELLPDDMLVFAGPCDEMEPVTMAVFEPAIEHAGSEFLIYTGEG